MTDETSKPSNDRTTSAFSTICEARALLEKNIDAARNRRLTPHSTSLANVNGNAANPDGSLTKKTTDRSPTSSTPKTIFRPPPKISADTQPAEAPPANVAPKPSVKRVKKMTQAERTKRTSDSAARAAATFQERIAPTTSEANTPLGRYLRLREWIEALPEEPPQFTYAHKSRILIDGELEEKDQKTPTLLAKATRGMINAIAERLPQRAGEARGFAPQLNTPKARPTCHTERHELFLF